MPKQEVTLQVDRDDRVTTNLARALVVAEIASQVVVCLVVLEMLEHGAISYKVAWHWKRLSAKYRDKARREREYRTSLAFMLYEVDEIEKKGADHE